MRGHSTPGSGPERRPSPLPLAAIVLLGAILRLVALDTVPPGINQDEAVRAYDAWCLRETGQDHYGASWPIFLRGFGKVDYPPGHYVYLLIPFQAILGVDPWSTRLPAALFGIAGIVFAFLLVRRIYGHRAGLLAALLLGVSPWPLHLSHLAFELSLCAPLLTSGLYLLARGAGNSNRQSPEAPVGWRCLAALMAGGVCLGLVLWTYNALRVVTPLLLIGGAAIYARAILAFLRRDGGLLAGSGFVLGFLAGLAPFIWAGARSPDEAWARAKAVSLVSLPMPWQEKLATAGRLYAAHFSPDFLFLRGDPWAVQSVTGYGKLHHVYMLFLLAGLVRVVARWRTERFGRLLVWWILIAPLPAAATFTATTHSLRAGGVIPAYDILAAIGIDFAIALAAGRSPRAARVLTGAALGALAINVAVFLHVFFVQYPVAAAREFQTEWKDLAQLARSERHRYRLFVFTHERANQPAILYLFWAGVDPRDYFGAPREIQQHGDWDFLVRTGDVFFMPSRYLRALAPLTRPGDRVLVAEREGIGVPGREIGRVRYPDSGTAVVLYEVLVGTGPATAPSAHRTPGRGATTPGAS